jgi:hypothetical protein
MSGPRKRGEVKDSKTEKISSMFSASPFKELSPKEISEGLGYDIQLVTTIVNRLMNEGFVERTGRGRYRLFVEQVVRPDHLSSMTREMKEFGRTVLGARSLEGLQPEGLEGLKGLVGTYDAIRIRGGSVLANNILRLAARKVLPEEDIEGFLGSVEEVVSK